MAKATALPSRLRRLGDALVQRRADLGRIEKRRNAHEGLLDHSFGEHRPSREQLLARHARHRVGGYLEVLFHELILVHLFEHM